MKTNLMQAVSRMLFLPMWMVALGILVKGYGQVGDGFSAGVLASLAVAMRWLVEGGSATGREGRPRWALTLWAVGLLLSLLTGFLPTVFGASPVTHFPGPGERVERLGSLELHTAVLFDGGIFLLVLGATVSALHAVGHFHGRSEA